MAFRGYWGIDDGAYALYIVNTNGCATRRVTHSIASFPSWSSDGKWLVFDGGDGLFKVRSNGNGLTRLTGPSPGSTSPAWSPTQNAIAFIRYSHGRGEIWQMYADGAGATMLHAEPGISYEDPAWSRDGTRIAVVARANGHSWIEVMNADGSHVRDITARTGDAWNPVWLPGNRGIAWLANGGSVFATRATGTNVIRILRAQAEEFAWSGTSSSGNTTPARSC